MIVKMEKVKLVGFILFEINITKIGNKKLFYW